MAVWKCSESINFAVECLRSCMGDEVMCDKACRILHALAKMDRSLFFFFFPQMRFLAHHLHMMFSFSPATRSKVRAVVVKDPCLAFFKSRIF